MNDLHKLIELSSQCLPELTDEEREALFGLTPEKVERFEEFANQSLRRLNEVMRIVEKLPKGVTDPDILGGCSEAREQLEKPIKRYERTLGYFVPLWRDRLKVEGKL